MLAPVRVGAVMGPALVSMASPLKLATLGWRRGAGRGVRAAFVNRVPCIA